MNNLVDPTPKSNLYLSEEDIEALNTVAFNYDAVKHIKEVLQAHHNAIYVNKTAEFLALKSIEIRNATNTDKLRDLMWEIVNWKENYKSPYTKD